MSIAAASANKTEGNSDTTPFTFTVTRTGVISGESHVNYVVTGSSVNAADAVDFEGGVLPSGTVDFAANETTKTITINVSGDTTGEKDEGFTVTLSNPTGATVGTATAAGTVVNDDTSLSIVSLSANKAEGNSATPTAFTFTVSRTGLTNVATTVSYAVTGTGDHPADVSSDFASGTSGTVTFPANSTASQTITVNVKGDTTVEFDEGFLVTLSGPSGNTTLTTATATGLIRGDDSSISIAALDASKAEGNSVTTPFTFQVSRDGGTSFAGSVSYAVTGTGGTATDLAGVTVGTTTLTTLTGTVTFVAGEASKMVTVNVKGDTVVEPDETFTVTLSAPKITISPSTTATAATLGTSTAIGTIRNDDGGSAALRAESLMPRSANETAQISLMVSVTVDAFGRLLITDLNGTPNDITVSRDALTDTLVISATTDELSSDGSTLANSVRIPAASVTQGLIANLGAGNDRLVLLGVALPAAINGGIGDDTIIAGSGNDTIVGGTGNDSLFGGAGNDIVIGGAGADTVDGEAGTDLVLGGQGNATRGGNSRSDTGDVVTSLAPDLIDEAFGTLFAFE